MGAELEPDGSEKRRAGRHRVLSRATIIVRGCKRFCVVRDLSNTGAKLGVSADVDLPNEFKLSFAGHPLQLQVRLMWRRGDFAGVQFSFPDHASTVICESQERFLVEE